MTGYAPPPGFRPIPAGADLRLPEYREEIFLRFWYFHLRLKAHPGCVYYVMPHLRQHYGWSDEQALWFAWLNGNTQNPITSLALMEQCPDGPAANAVHVERMLDWYGREFKRLAWDTDRRHWKSKLRPAVEAYRDALRPHGGSQARMWEAAASGGFAGVWDQAVALYGFGRLSAFSYSEYLRILGYGAPCDSLFLADHDGSRSHRNGLALVAGRADLIRDPHLSDNPDTRLSPGDLRLLEDYADRLVDAMHARVNELPVDVRALLRPDVGYFTLESALCTFKSWHKPNRRYPNVYNDMLYDRLRWYQARWPHAQHSRWTQPIWNARAAWLPEWARLELNPTDPGCVPAKQNHYLTTGQTVMMGHIWPALRSGFDRDVELGMLGLRADLRPENRKVLR